LVVLTSLACTAVPLFVALPRLTQAEPSQRLTTMLRLPSASVSVQATTGAPVPSTVKVGLAEAAALLADTPP